MKLMVVGDTHGNTRHLRAVLNEAGKLKIQHVVQVGDFGLWDHKQDGIIFLDEINLVAEANKLSVYAIGGNHENWDHWNWYVENMPKSKGFAMLRSRILLAPKIHTWTWANKKFAAAGGAVSIDKQWRVQEEAGGQNYGLGRTSFKPPAPRTLWWPDEELTDEHVEEIKRWKYKADVFFTHDCSNYTPFGQRLKPDLDSQIHRQRIDKVINHLRPELHFHGHMHEKYDWENGLSSGYEHYTQTYGLECDSMYWSYGILDTDKMEFTWRSDD